MIIILMLSMGLLPVANAFAFCLDMNPKSPDQVLLRSLVGVDHAVHSTADARTKSHGDGRQKQTDCHAVNGCTVHACGGFALITVSAFLTDAGAGTSDAPNIHSLKNRITAPEIRPPIHLL
ncbi:MAG: hypothetical protein ABFS02_13425 [Pseudomonadota bacterium]